MACILGHITYKGVVYIICVAHIFETLSHPIHMHTLYASGKQVFIQSRVPVKNNPDKLHVLFETKKKILLFSIKLLSVS